MKAHIFSFLVFSFFSVSAMGAKSTGGLSCKYVPHIQEGFLNQHVTFKRSSKNLEKRVVDQLLKRLDPLKIYLLDSDEKKLRKKLKGVFVKSQNSDCDAIHNANEYVEKKIAERVEFVRSFLGPKYKFRKDVKISLDSDKRKRFKNTEQVNEFHKKYIHFQISNYILSDSSIDEAKKSVVKNYERILKRVQKETKENRLADYLDAFAHALDPHSSFFSYDDLENFQIQMSLSLEGIGATLSWKDGFTVVESLVPGGAADRSGLVKAKDKIVAVSQGKNKKAENVIDMELNEVVKKIRGKKGTKVVLTVLRKSNGKNKRLQIPLVRDKINLEDEAAQITYHKKKVGGEKKTIGLINLPSFYSDGKINGRSAAKDLKKLLKQADRRGVDGIVLDLSNNGGGSLEDAVKIAGLFFKTGNVVKQSSPDPGRPAISLTDVDSTVNYSGPLAILTSRASASASEIVAGTLKDYGRAVIVGADHTFGKGTVQSVRNLPKKLGAIKVTVGMFFTAGGFSTQHRGVEADVTLPSVLSNEEIGEKTYDYSLPPKKLGTFLSSSAYVHQGKNKWAVVDKSTIKELQDLSKKRVNASKDFKEIKDDIKKSDERGKIVDLAEVMKEREEKKKDDDEKDKVLTKDQKLEKYLERADVIEAIDVVTDLIRIEEKKPLTLSGRSAKRKGASSSN